MKNTRRKALLRRAVIWGFGLVVLASGCLFVLYEPQVPLGSALFKWLYTHSSHKQALLKDYNSDLFAHNGGGIPVPIDRFLCSRLEHPTSTEELAALTDFYAEHVDGYGGDAVFRLPPPAKTRVAGQALSRLDHDTPEQATKAIFLVEALRRGGSLFKPGIAPKHETPLASSDYEKWWRQVGVPEARSRFQKWWVTYPTWTKKEKHDPLEYSSVEIREP